VSSRGLDTVLLWGFEGACDAAGSLELVSEEAPPAPDEDESDALTDVSEDRADPLPDEAGCEGVHAASGTSRHSVRISARSRFAFFIMIIILS